MGSRRAQFKPSTDLCKVLRLNHVVWAWIDCAFHKPRRGVWLSRSATGPVQQHTIRLPLMGRIQLWDWMAVVAIVVMAGLVHGQPGPASASTSGEKAAPAPIPLADVATEAESVFATIRDIRADLSSERITARWRNNWRRLLARSTVACVRAGKSLIKALRLKSCAALKESGAVYDANCLP
jgi:hypothetical protein